VAVRDVDEARLITTTVIGSYPFPGWLELVSGRTDEMGPDDLEEAARDATLAAVMDQVRAGLDVISDGEQGRFDFNLSFYAYLEGLELESAPRRRWGPPAHDQRGKHRLVGELRAPGGLGAVEEFERLRELVKSIPPTPELKASVPGPYTLAGRIAHPDRWAVTDMLVPIVAAELSRLVDAGCKRITLDEPSMSCYAWREDTARMVDVFNRTVAGVKGRCHLGTHLCFGNFKGRAVGKRRYAPMFPAFLEMDADELHFEMASREFAELEVIEQVVAAGKDVNVGVIDVKSYYVESPEDVEERVRACLRHVPAERLSVSPDCGLSQTARWAARRKLESLVAGARRARE
jgi:5-methyltetrahydropteroyltriglutamate--homocysteine methyltransferase